MKNAKKEELKDKRKKFHWKLCRSKGRKNIHKEGKIQQWIGVRANNKENKKSRNIETFKL